MKTHSLPITAAVALTLLNTAALAADPLLDSWFTANSGQYARVVETTGGAPVTTWPSPGLPSMGGGQAAPSYSDVQEIAWSANWVYVRSSGLASHLMGPWYLDVAKTMLFRNWPAQTSRWRRFPRQPQPATGTRTLTGLGAVGYWVNGVAMFDMRDAFSYRNSTGQDNAAGDGIWNRDAWINEGVTFDPGNAHQPNNGQYHYHVHPLLLRQQLGDNVTYDPGTGRYRELTNGWRHSPILAWTGDGYPIYGPYGYANPSNATSAVRRMVAGYVLRNGASGSTDLRVTGRNLLPKWAAEVQNRATNLTAAQSGPAVSAAFPLGRYIEDNDYLGDLGFTPGVHFDLNRQNVRWCVTPEFPQGIYAYFTAINADGTPAYPYVTGREFFGVVSGGAVTQITEPVTTLFLGGTNLPVKLAVPTAPAGQVTLSWSSIDGGSYAVQASTTLTQWMTLTSNVPAGGLKTSISNAVSISGTSRGFYRVSLTGVAPYDP